MRKVVAIFLVIGLSQIASGQFPIPVDSLYTFIKYNSVSRHSVDWEEADQLFREKISEAKTLQDTMKSFVHILEMLNDVHSQIFLDNQYYGHYPAFDNETLDWLKPLNDKAIQSTNQVRAEILNKKIGYVAIPSIQVNSQQEINSYAQKIYDSLSKLVRKKLKGIIIDLRLNGGGNIYPMLAGISAILGDKTIAFETDADNQVVRMWKIENGNFIIGDYKATEISMERRLKLETIPVVVLMGPVTKSAGSMVAIALKKRPNTIFIGEPTAEGYTTSNGYFQFASNLSLNFATNLVADREMNIYKTNVQPDINIYRGDHFENLKADLKIKAAIDWLINNHK